MTNSRLDNAIIDFAEEQKSRGWVQLDTEPFSTENITCVSATAQITPGANLYGFMYVHIKHEDHIYRILWRIHVPNMKYASKANDPLDIKEMTLETDRRIPDLEFLEAKDTDFGTQAFWLHTPDDSLSRNDLYLRQVFRKIKAWSVENQMCKKLRRTDRQHLKIKQERENQRRL